MSNSLFNDNLKGPRFLRALFAQVNGMARCLNNLIGAGVVPNEFGGFNFAGGGPAGLNLRRFGFGWMGVLDRTVYIRGGIAEGRGRYMRIGGSGFDSRFNGYPVQVGGSADAPHLIIAKGNDLGGIIEPNSVSESSYLGENANEWSRVLYRVYLRDGKPVMDEIGPGVGGIVL